VEHVASRVVDAAFKLHKELGPGILESVRPAWLMSWPSAG